MIPVDLCKYVIRHNLYSAFQLYMLLKSECNGTIRIANSDMVRYAKLLCFKSHKTIKNNLVKLLKLNWVGYHQESELYFVRGFQKIMFLHDLSSTARVEFDFENIEHVKAFIAATAISYLVNYQRGKKWAAELKKGGSRHTAHFSSKGYYPVANLALAKILGISLSTAFQLKKLAAKNGFIKIKKSYRDTGLPKSNFMALAKGNPNVAKRAKIKNGLITLQLPDLVMHGLRFSNRKNLETYKKGG